MEKHEKRFIRLIGVKLFSQPGGTLKCKTKLRCLKISRCGRYGMPTKKNDIFPSPKAESFKMWLAQVGSERLDEIADPEKARVGVYDRL